LNSKYVPPDSQVCISTIQRMYSILKGEELDETAEQINPYEYVEMGRPREVEYNEKVPPEFFDFIVIDECHRSIYNLCRNKLNKDVFESICAFLNRNGGDLILGVNDNEKDNRHRPRSGGAGQKRAGDRPQ
jgi:type I site-specific restriction endonuclease